MEVQLRTTGWQPCEIIRRLPKRVCVRLADGNVIKVRAAQVREAPKPVEPEAPLKKKRAPRKKKEVVA